ncbi:MAG TPA: Flp pilus assembly protein CpaB [Candidatus Acidoferrales bacterium]
MKWNRMLIAAAVAIVVGLVASNFVYKQMKQATVVKPVATSKVVLAAMRLPLGTRLEAKHLRQVSWPASDPIPGMFTRIEDCVNRALITFVVENEPILEGKLAPEKAGAGLPATIPEGMRALSVAVNEVVGVAGFVLPGTMVDVLVTGSLAGRGRGDSNSVTRTILENVRVLAAGQKVEQDKEGKPQTVPVITLLVTPEEANKLTMASTEGKIQLALRNTIDMKRTEPPAVLRTSLFAGPPQPRPRRVDTQPPPVVFAVEVIRGSKRETSTF